MTPTEPSESSSRPPADPSHPDTLRKRIAAIPYWYHRIQLPGGVVTSGLNPFDPTMFGVPADLSGLRVLDIGAWDGYWTFQALKRGAREVVAIDDFSQPIGNLRTPDRPAWETFDLCRSALGYREDRCQRIDMPFYSISRQQLGTFDVVFFFGTIYRLKHPLLALELISDVCAGDIYVESAVLDDFSPYRGGIGKGYPGGQMVAEFYPSNEYGDSADNWWVPTLHCLGQMIRVSGFPRVYQWKLQTEPAGLPFCRGFAMATKKDHVPTLPASGSTAQSTLWKPGEVTSL